MAASTASLASIRACALAEREGREGREDRRIESERVSVSTRSCACVSWLQQRRAIIPWSEGRGGGRLLPGLLSVEKQEVKKERERENIRNVLSRVFAINSNPTFRGTLPPFRVFPLPLRNRQASRFINCCFPPSFAPGNPAFRILARTRERHCVPMLCIISGE